MDENVLEKIKIRLLSGIWERMQWQGLKENF